MKVRTLRGFLSPEGHVRRGVLLDVDDKRGAMYVRKGLATEVRMSSDPLPHGPTGEAKRSSSSRLARQQRPPTSKKGAERQGS